MFLLKKKFVSTPDSEQSKTLLTIDELGSKLARNSVLIAKCRLFDVDGNKKKTMILTIFGLFRLRL